MCLRYMRTMGLNLSSISILGGVTYTFYTFYYGLEVTLDRKYHDPFAFIYGLYIRGLIDKEMVTNTRC